MRNGRHLDAPGLALDAATADDLATEDETERSLLYFPDPTHVLVAVSDGVGSPEGVALGNQRALSTLLSTYRELPAGTALTQRMMRSARNASFATYELAVVLPQLRDVSTTLTAVAVAGGQMTAAHVGDGRVYLRRDGTLTQLSKDATVAAEAAAEGRSYVGDRGDRLTRALGRELLVPIDLFEIELRPGDDVLVCTQGIHRTLPESRLAATLEDWPPADACHRLVEQARREGARAGSSVAIVAVRDATAAAAVVDA